MKSIGNILVATVLISLGNCQTNLTDIRVFYNGSGIVFFKAQEPLTLLVNNVTFTLDNEPTAISGVSENGTSTLHLRFENVKGEGSNILASADIQMNFIERAGWWRMSSAMVSASGTADNKPIANTDVEVIGSKVEAPQRYSYHCSRVLRYRSLANDSLTMSIKGIQVQPFGIRNDRFDDGYDCEGFFTVAIWAGIFIAILMGTLLAWGINMIMSINTPDRFDDPKGKPLVINAQE